MIKLPDFIIIPYQLLEDKKITLIDERVYGIIYWLTKLKNEKCTASNKTLSELVKTTTGTIQNSLSKLEQLGYIKRIFKDNNKKIRKEIIALVIFTKVSFTDDTQVSPTSDTVSPTSDTRVSPTSDQNKNIYNKNNKEYIATHGVAGIDINSLIKLFEPVNPSYERLYANKTQRSALERLIKKWGEEKIENTIKALPDIINKPYAPKIITPLELERDLGKLITFYKQEKTKVKKGGVFIIK